MATVPLIGYKGTANFTGSTTYYLVLSGNIGGTGNTSEGDWAHKFKTAGTFDKLRVLVDAFGGANATLNLRVAGSDTTMTVTLTGTGAFEDNSHPQTISSDDIVIYKLVTGAATIGLGPVRVQYTTTSVATNVFIAANSQNYTTDSSSHFPTLNGALGNEGGTATEANGQVTIRAAGTLKNLGVIASSSRATDTLVKLRINGADGAGGLVATITAGAAQAWFADTTHTESVSSGDKVNFSIVTSTGGGTAIFKMIKVDFETTETVVLSAGTGAGLNVSASATAYIGLSSAFGTTTTETDNQTVLNQALTASSISVFVSANTVVADSTFDLRVGAASSALTKALTGLTTGWFEDTGHTVSIGTSDAVNFRVVGGAGGTNLTVRNMSVVMAPTAGGTIPPVINNPVIIM